MIYYNGRDWKESRIKRGTLVQFWSNFKIHKKSKIDQNLLKVSM